MENKTLKLEKRELTGKKTAKLRREGILPAVVFEADKDSLNVQLDSKEFAKVYSNAGHSTLIDIEFSGKKFKVLINEVQYNPRTRAFNHVMLNKVDLKEEITASVPLELVGEAPAVKAEKAIIVAPVDELEIKCLPTDLPQHIEVNITALNAIGDSITVADIKLPKGVKLVHEDDTELVLATATAPQKEEEETTTAEVSPEEVELSVKKGKEETTEE